MHRIRNLGRKTNVEWFLSLYFKIRKMVSLNFHTEAIRIPLPHKLTMPRASKSPYCTNLPKVNFQTLQNIVDMKIIKFTKILYNTLTWRSWRTINDFCGMMLGLARWGSSSVIVHMCEFLCKSWNGWSGFVSLCLVLEWVVWPFAAMWYFYEIGEIGLNLFLYLSWMGTRAG